MGLITGLIKLIEKESHGEYNPVACVEEEIYSGLLNPGTKNEIIIPRVGDLIQELRVKYINPLQLLNVSKAYIETESYNYENKMLNMIPVKKQWLLNIFYKDDCLKLISNYEVNLLNPYQVTKLIITSDSQQSIIPIKIIANYCFIGLDNRKKLFFNALQ